MSKEERDLAALGTLVEIQRIIDREDNETSNEDKVAEIYMQASIFRLRWVTIGGSHE
jgi:hypothetical protein